MIRGRSGSPFTQFLFHSFAQPLFNHALVVQETRPRQPFDPRQHPRVDTQCDRHRFRRFRRGRARGFHQPQVRTVFGPKRRFGLVAVEKRNFFPVRDGVHVRLCLTVLRPTRMCPSLQSRRLRLLTANFVPALARQRLIQFALIEELFFRVKRPGINNPNLFPIRPIHAEHPGPAR